MNRRSFLCNLVASVSILVGAYSTKSTRLQWWFKSLDPYELVDGRSSWIGLIRPRPFPQEVNPKWIDATHHYIFWFDKDTYTQIVKPDGDPKLEDPSTPFPNSSIMNLIGRYDALEWETYDPEFLKALDGMFGNK